MDSTHKKRLPSKVIAVICTVIAVLVATGVYAWAASGGGGAGVSHGRPHAGLNCSRIYEDGFDKNNNPVQGWDSDSVNYFWNKMQEEMGANFFVGGMGNYDPWGVYTEAAYVAIENAKSRSDIPNVRTRIIAVGWVWSKETNGAFFGSNYLPDDNKASKYWIMPAPDEKEGILDVIDPDPDEMTIWSEWLDEYPGDDGQKGERWIDYIYRNSLNDVNKPDDGTGLSVVVIAVNEDQPASGIDTTLTKKVTGQDSKQGTFERALYEATQKNPEMYDLSGAQFTLYDDAGNIVQGRALDEEGNPISSRYVNVVFTTTQDGSTQHYSIAAGDYWLKETKAPNAGYMLDTDGDGEPDDTDKDTNPKGKHVSISKQTSSDGKVQFEWYDTPLFDTNPLTLYKRDAETGGLSSKPIGNGELNGAQYRIAYYPGVYKTIDEIPGYNASTNTFDWSKADTTAIWTSHSYTAENGKTYPGQMDIGADTPTSGTWKYRFGNINVVPLGTILIKEEVAPTGYLLDPRAYLVSSMAENGKIVHVPWQANGTQGTDDWTQFLSEKDLNGGKNNGGTIWD